MYKGQYASIRERLEVEKLDDIMTFANNRQRLSPCSRMVQNLGKLGYGSGRFVSLSCSRMKGRDGGRRRSAKKGEVGGRGKKNAFPFPLPPPSPLPLSPLYACYTG